MCLSVRRGKYCLRIIFSERFDGARHVLEESATENRSPPTISKLVQNLDDFIELHLFQQYEENTIIYDLSVIIIILVGTKNKFLRIEKYQNLR